MPDKKATNFRHGFLLSSPEAWYRLRLFNYFRSALALFFITIYMNGWLLELIPTGYSHPTLFINVAFIYLAASLFFITGLIRRKPGLDTVVFVEWIRSRFRQPG